MTFALLMGTIGGTYLLLAKFRRTPALTPDGVQSRRGMIKWDEIAEIYSVHLLSPSIRNETRTLTIIAKDGKKAFWRLIQVLPMSNEQREAFEELRLVLVDRVAERQWKDFAARLAGKELMRFGDFALSDRGIFLGAKASADPDIPLSAVVGWSVGPVRTWANVYPGLFVCYQESGEDRAKQIGAVHNTPNIHVVTDFLQKLADRNAKEVPGASSE